MRIRVRIGLVALAVGALTASAGTAGAAAPPDVLPFGPAVGAPGSVTVSAGVFEGKVFGANAGRPAAAKACLVWPDAKIGQGTGVECFRTRAAMAAFSHSLDTKVANGTLRLKNATAYRRASTRPGVKTIKTHLYCSAGAELYNSPQFTSYLTTIRQRGHWVNLGVNFNDKTTSYRMVACGGHLAEGYNGAGYWCPYPTYAGGQMADLNGTTWNDRISSVYLN